MNDLLPSFYRVVVFTTAVCWMISFGMAGERIIFSKPDGIIIAPDAQMEARLPNNENHSILFAPQPAAPPVFYVPPRPQMDPSRPTEHRTLFDEPELFSDKSLGDVNPNKRPQLATPWSTAPFDLTRGGNPDRALSPIRQYDWTPEGDSTKKAAKDTLETQRHLDSGLFGRLREQDQNPRDESLGGFFNSPSKHELTRGELERKAEWNQLLNPTLPSVSGREHVSDFASAPTETARIPGPLLVSPSEPPPRASLDPMQNYNDQQRRWRGPSMEDLNRKVFGNPAPKPETTPETADRRPSLMRQPTFQDFPGRKF